jgi:hypothetical protein
MRLLISLFFLLLAAPLFAGGSIGGSTGGAGAVLENLQPMEMIVLEPSIVDDLRARLKAEKMVPIEIDSQIYLMQKVEERIVDESLTMEVVSE